MPYFGDGGEVREALAGCLGAFFSSPAGAAARDQVYELADSATLVVHTVDPHATVAVDFLKSQILSDPPAAPDVELELEADALHDILLERLDPVQISRLYETDRLAFRGDASKLAGLIVLAGPVQRCYEESLERSGRLDLLDTPRPEPALTWTAEGPYREVIGKRRPWQRPKSRD